MFEEDLFPTLQIGSHLFGIRGRQSHHLGVAVGYVHVDSAVVIMAASLDGQEKYTQMLPSVSLTHRFTGDISAGLK